MRPLHLLVVALLISTLGCDSVETRSTTNIFVVRRDVKAGEQFTENLVDEIGFSDATGQFDVRKDFAFVTRSTFADYVEQYFNKDLGQFSPVRTADLTEQIPDHN